MQYFLLIGKKVIYDILTEPDRVFKNILIAIMAVLLIIFMFVMPIVVITNIPLVYLSDGENTTMQEEIIEKYKESIKKADEKYKKWVEKQKKNLNGVNKIIVNYDFNLNYNDLISVDTILLQQDFTQVESEKISELIEKFVYTDVRRVVHINNDGGVIIYGIITVKILSTEEVMDNLNFSENDKNYVRNYIKNIGLLKFVD